MHDGGLRDCIRDCVFQRMLACRQRAAVTIRLAVETVAGRRNDAGILLLLAALLEFQLHDGVQEVSPNSDGVKLDPAGRVTAALFCAAARERHTVHLWTSKNTLAPASLGWFVLHTAGMV